VVLARGPLRGLVGDQSVSASSPRASLAHHVSYTRPSKPINGHGPFVPHPNPPVHNANYAPSYLLARHLFLDLGSPRVQSGGMNICIRKSQMLVICSDIWGYQPVLLI